MSDPDNPRPRVRRLSLPLLAALFTGFLPGRHGTHVPDPPLPPLPPGPTEARPVAPPPWLADYLRGTYHSRPQREPIPWRTDADRLARAEEKRERRRLRNLDACRRVALAYELDHDPAAF